MDNLNKGHRLERDNIGSKVVSLNLGVAKVLTNKIKIKYFSRHLWSIYRTMWEVFYWYYFKHRLYKWNIYLIPSKKREPCGRGIVKKFHLIKVSLLSPAVILKGRYPKPDQFALVLDFLPAMTQNKMIHSRRFHIFASDGNLDWTDLDWNVDFYLLYWDLCLLSTHWSVVWTKQHGLDMGVIR